jgi:hypothetical protein
LVDILSDEWITQANEELLQKRCKFEGCGAVGTLRVERKLMAHLASLAGAQMKFSGSYEAIMTCSACGRRGRLHV